MEATDNCGNSLLDEGEECDCGLNYDDNGICRENSCCMGSNCTLNGDIQCRYVQWNLCYRLNIFCYQNFYIFDKFVKYYYGENLRNFHLIYYRHCKNEY